VYGWSWRRTCPACHLAVHALGHERALDYFRRRDALDLTTLVGRVEQLARELTAP
jgi:hypothetical protein